MEIISHSENQTEKIANTLSQALKQGDIVALSGDLGAGKTAFSRGMAKGLGYNGRVTSPTFSIVNEYMLDDYTIYHFDMYRITNEDELYNIGFDDYLNANGILIIEWSENIIEYLPKDIFYVNIKNISEDERKITLGGKYENFSVWVISKIS